MNSTVKAWTIVAAVTITFGALVLSWGSISHQATADEPDANIGAGIALTFGPYIVGIGLLAGAVAAVTALSQRRTTKR
ncbi:hypothetical protein AB5J62_01985 [Amycolatopsis sp. cg5]|uniref:hypothetical protein n=1 Tax=Amycolatopsis sp. cg5 TaxID=3238802 RepID=UPI003525A30C